MKLLDCKFKQSDKLFYYGCPIVTYILASFAGFWWINDEGLWGGMIYMFGLLAFAYEIGYKQYYKSSPFFFYVTFVIPSLLSIILFVIGIFVER